MAETTSSRIRKAWLFISDAHRSADPPDAIFAPTRSKARAICIAAMRDAWDCTWLEAARSIVSLRRWPERDVALPQRHPVALELGDKLLHIVVHAYGGRGLRAGYRDHFYTRADDPELVALLQRGLFYVGRRVPAAASGGEPHAYFLLTPLGRRVAAGEQPEYPDDA